MYPALFSRAFPFSVVLILFFLSPAGTGLHAVQANRPARALAAPLQTAPFRFLGSFSTSRDSKGLSLRTRVVDVLAGPADADRMQMPSAITTDTKGRVIVVDSAYPALHIFDFASKKYLRIEGGKDERMKAPVAVATDAENNIYVTDSSAAMVLVFDEQGRFRHYIGQLQGEGSDFERPTGLAIDRNSGRLYLSDTPRNLVLIVDPAGRVTGRLGVRGGGSQPGQFKYPADVVVSEGEVFVLDPGNSRVQVFDLNGKFRRQFNVGRPPVRVDGVIGMSVDAGGNLFLADRNVAAVKVFRRNGQLLYSFDGGGTRSGAIKDPAGVWVSSGDRLYISDPREHRVAVFEAGKPAR